MTTTRGSIEDRQGDENSSTPADLAHLQDAELDALLAQAPRYSPPAGFEERVLAALHAEEVSARLAPSLPRPWYLRPYGWGSVAAAACAVACACLALLMPDSSASLPAESLAVDDVLLVEEALDSIDDPDLVYAICSVSNGAMSSSATYPY